MAIDESRLIYELHILGLSTDQTEIVIGLLSYINVEAIEERDGVLVLYHDSEKRINEIENELKGLAPWIQNNQINRDTRANENWNHSWESSFKPIMIEDFCTIKASFHNINSNTKHVIVIDPEMAFGTGHHETTYGMIYMMAKIDFSDRGVLDFGSGTGILSILAAKLGARAIRAIDHDILSTECAEKCKILNETPMINCSTNIITDLEESQYDIILANINRKVLLDTVEEIFLRLKNQGVLLLSGILTQDYELVSKHYVKQGFVIIDEFLRGNWMTLRLQKK